MNDSKTQKNQGAPAGGIGSRSSEIKKAVIDARLALRQDPDNHLLIHSLAILLQTEGNNDKALHLYKRAARLNPGSIDYLFHLGRLQSKTRDTEGAIESFEKIISLDPAHEEAHLNLGFIEYEIGNFPKSVTHLKKTLEAKPDSEAALLHLAVIQIKTGRDQEAMKNLEALLKIDPENTTPRHLIGAMKGQSEETAPEGYVSGLFDVYSENFDIHLLENLRYKVPDMMRQALERVLNEDERALRVLDLGCGTGLTGSKLRDIAHYLSGVDISARMLERAAAKNIYDELHEEDMLEALKGKNGSFNLVIAADVFIYRGDLAPVFTECSRALCNGGLFAFSTESFHGEDYILRRTGRFAHSPAYIFKLAAENGYTAALFDEIIVRLDNETPVAGNLFVLSKGPREPRPASSDDLDNMLQDVSSLYEEAVLQHQAGNIQNAESLYWRILEAEPEHADALHFLGVIAMRANHLDDAFDLISRAIAQNPEAPLYYTNLGLVLHARDDIEEASAAMKKALDISPRNIYSLLTLAKFQFDQGELSKAAENALQVVGLQPNLADARHVYGAILLEQGKFDEAEHNFRQAIGIDAENPEYHRNFAMFLIQRERHAEAEEICQQLLKLSPGNPEAEELLNMCRGQAQD